VSCSEMCGKKGRSLRCYVRKERRREAIRLRKGYGNSAGQDGRERKTILIGFQKKREGSPCLALFWKGKFGRLRKKAQGSDTRKKRKGRRAFFREKKKRGLSADYAETESA